MITKLSRISCCFRLYCNLSEKFTLHECSRSNKRAGVSICKILISDTRVFILTSNKSLLKNYWIIEKTTADLLSGQKSIIEKLRKNYAAYVEDITNIKSLLEDQVFSLYYCLDSEQLAEQYPPLNNSQDYYYKLQMCSSIKEALDSLINGYMIVLNVYNDDGSVDVGNNPQYVGSLSSPNHGVQCLNCGSTNLQYDRDYVRYYCANKGCTAGYKKVVTYFDYAKAIYKWFDENYGKGDYFSNIENNIRKIQTDLYIRNNFTDENYKELCSFIREDVYENSNYTSDNIVDNRNGT